MARLLSLLDPIAERPSGSLQFLTGPRSLYSAEEVTRAIALPAILFSEFDAETARSLAALFNGDGVEVRAVEGNRIGRSLLAPLKPENPWRFAVAFMSFGTFVAIAGRASHAAQLLVALSMGSSVLIAVALDRWKKRRLPPAGRGVFLAARRHRFRPGRGGAAGGRDRHRGGCPCARSTRATLRRRDRALSGHAAGRAARSEIGGPVERDRFAAPNCGRRAGIARRPAPDGGAARRSGCGARRADRGRADAGADAAGARGRRPRRRARVARRHAHGRRGDARTPPRGRAGAGAVVGEAVPAARARCGSCIARRRRWTRPPIGTRAPWRPHRRSWTLCWSLRPDRISTLSRMDLFARSAEKDRRGQPLAERMRPRSLDGVRRPGAPARSGQAAAARAARRRSCRR